MRYTLLLPTALVFSALSLPAQTGTYTTFGSGCASSVSSCPSSNAGAKPLGRPHNTNVFAHPIVPTGPLVIRGFSYYLKTVGTTPIKVTAKIYKADNQGKPQNPAIATTIMVVTPKLAWHSAVFAKPLLFKKGEKFFINHEGGNKVTFSYGSITTGKKSTHYWRPATSTAWRGPYNSVPWLWKVNCIGGKSITSLSNTGVPKIGGSFAVKVGNTLPNTAAALLIGASNTKFSGLTLPFSLTPLGASGCFLNVSMDALVTTLVNGQGQGQVNLGLPNDTKLLGIKFHNQYLVLDKLANTMGLSWSNGGTGVVGR